jgi:tetratricopeptide (TPR) repeat protein
LDPEMASEPEPEGYLGEQLGARHTPIGSAGLTPSVSQPVADELPFISGTPSDPLEAISYPFGATGADDLLSAADVVDEEQSDELLIEEVVLEANASETAAGAAEDADDEPIELPTPSFTRRATMVAVQSVETLKARIEAEPDNWSRHRDLAEAMLEAGDRAGGLRELATAMAGAERAADLGLASSIADEIARLEPEVVRNHQKRVEYAFRMNDRARLIDAYLSLGDALLRSGQDDKARTVYQRVLDLAPDDIRARAALDTLVAVESTPTVATPAHRTDGPADPPRRRAPLEPARRPDGSLDNNFVDLGRLLRDDRPKDLRMVVEEKAPTGDEAADFAEMLRKFKQGVAENVDAEDYQSHYDLAIAYKEMGLLDEAIAEFQKALAGPSNRLPTFEALGQCFLEKKQHKMAASILARALTEREASEEKLIGVLYLLGRATEMQGRMDEALSYYQRVFVTDIEFRDIAERINALERVAR